MQRPGFTTLEVRIAYALMAGLAIGATSVGILVDRMDRQDGLQLAAEELAQELVLQFMDNPSLMPDESNPIPVEADGRIEKLWYQLDDSHSELTAEERTPARQMRVTIDVYKDNNGRRARVPIASITDVFDPFALADDHQTTFMKNVETKFEGQPEVQALLQSLSAQMVQEQQMKNQQNAPPTMQQPTPPSEAPPK